MHALITSGGGIGLLYLAPALVLGALLVIGLYPGEQTLARPLLRARSRPRRRRPTAPAPRRARRLHARGGLLLASGLAGRGPPARAVRLS